MAFGSRGKSTTRQKTLRVGGSKLRVRSRIKTQYANPVGFSTTVEGPRGKKTYFMNYNWAIGHAPAPTQDALFDLAIQEAVKRYMGGSPTPNPAKGSLKNVFMYVLKGCRKPKAAGWKTRHDYMRLPSVSKWWIVRAQSAEQARKIIKAGYIADRPDEPGIIDSNIIPEFVERRKETERTKHLEKTGPRAGLPRHEIPKGMEGIAAAFTSPGITWGTEAPYWMGEPFAMQVGYSAIAKVSVPVLAHEKTLSSGALVPIARKKAMAFADVMGWSLAFRPVRAMYRKRRFTDQHGKSRMGVSAEIRFEITGGLEFMDKLKLRSYGMFL